jgi:6-phosphogluconolactonase
MPLKMYVTVSEDHKIAMFDVDAETGKLYATGEVEVSGRPAPLAINPDRTRLYVGRRDINEISSFEIDQTTGGLSMLGTASLESDPCYLSTDKTGNFLLSAYYSGGRAAVHSINESGVAVAPPVEWLATDTGAHCMQTDPSNRFAFVPHIAGGSGPNLIFQFKFDEATGHITPNDPPTVPQEPEAGPRHYCFHPSKDVVYFSNEQSSSVTAYNLDTENGTLTAFQTVPTLPDDYDGPNSCAQIHMASTGDFLFAPNRGHNSMACFSVDSDSGRLERTAIVPTEAVPRAFGLDPDGNFLYVAGLESGRLAAYRINKTKGSLEHIETYDVGAEPMWVMITPLSG